MADIKEIKEFLTSVNRFRVCAIKIDECAYDISDICTITENTTLSDTVIIAYSTDLINDEVVATTHYITLGELEGADTVEFAEYNIVRKVV